MSEWRACTKILCIRPDNMGDLVMTGPALRALKETFKCHITLLTSSRASPMVAFMPEIDEVLVFDLPWVKTDHQPDQSYTNRIVNSIKERRFDAGIIFTVYSQSSLPAALLLYMAAVPRRLAYSRENPYDLLTHWFPDPEPYSCIKHQVKRDLDLVAFVGATTTRAGLKLVPRPVFDIKRILAVCGVDPLRKWLIIHTGVSEEKREYPVADWVQLIRLLEKETEYQLVMTGTANERNGNEKIIKAADGKRVYNLAGSIDLNEFIQLIKAAPLVITVNTSTSHIAAAMETPLLVLYALTNPQHFPWQGKGRVLLYDIEPLQRSRNEVIRFVHQYLHPVDVPVPEPAVLLKAVLEIVAGNVSGIPELPQLRRYPGESEQG